MASHAKQAIDQALHRRQHTVPAAPERRIVYGRHPVLEALRTPGAVRRLWFAAGMRPASILDDITLRARSAGAPIATVSRAELDRLTDGGHHQGVAAETAPTAPAPLESLVALAAARDQTPLLVAVDHLQDPQNLGSLLRTAEAAGAHGLVLPDRRSVGLTPAVVRASAGATAYLDVAEVVNLAQSLERLKGLGLWVVGLDAAAALDYDQADLTVPLVIVVGAEGAGLSRLVAQRCDVLVRIPLRGRIASLNAAVAGAVLLYEVVRQRRREQGTALVGSKGS